ncbi:DEAD/DEAH box helicase [Prolixibacteraceae bacterium Z1-6]|uniref:DEAD/DEAH box helicase n=1 Tax=Draconibacterium aestuarii TaxID=2998507 RepID=A0A9X3F8G2_9BACT|nr:DEAD/DEAH box helicase [Prolixibacteraceae bacterium Z1-6]
MSFTNLGLAPALFDVLAEKQYAKAYPIQQAAIPAILKGKDVLGIAATGSGKTASFVLPLLSNLQNNLVTKNRHVSVLVVVPTRELAVQVQKVFQTFSSGLPQKVKSMAVYGGVSVNPQMIALQGVNVLVATPGRLLELVESKAVHLSAVKTLVLDEADKMLNLGFKDEMNRIIALLPQKRQNLLFSATLNDDLDSITQVLLHQPEVIKIAPQKETPALINQVAYFVQEEKKGPLLRYLLKNNGWQQVLVFASSGFRADAIADKLIKNGIDAEAIHGKKSQWVRTEALRQFKAGEIQVLVSTDLLARGIDIEFLPCVINYELPRSPKDYIHRIGRTGRAESPGDAISLVTPDEEHHFKIIQKKMGRMVERIETEDLNLKGY